MARLRRTADELGLPLGKREKTFNTRLAQELGKWAEAQGKGREFHRAAFRAYFVAGVNLAQVDELVALAESVGLDGAAARRVVTERKFKEAVDADWRRSRVMGVTAVPTFVAGGRGLVGLQPESVLERLLLQAGAEPKR